MTNRALFISMVGLVLATVPASAEQLYQGSGWANLAGDSRARQLGDVLMVLISESASATNRVRNRSSKETDIGGGVNVGGVDEQASLRLKGGFAGSGEVERTDRFITRMAATVVEVMPNGDFVIVGRQEMNINGEKRNIQIRGQIRQVDISEDNAILSSRIANARIDYDGKGWVSRSAKPGLINKIFSFLGIG